MYILVNNVKLYYEEYGEGTPLIMLHGNGESSKIYKNIIAKLSQNNRVILVDSRCHGKSGKGELSYDNMAMDIIELIIKLRLNKPIIYGFSDGGIVALLIAIKEPKLLKRIIISGANIAPEGLDDKLIKRGKIIYSLTRSRLWGLMLKEPHISIDELNKIEIPVNMIVGEKDCIKLSHTKLIHDNIKNSTLEILENENHSSYIIKSPKLFDVINKYLIS